MAYGRAFYPEMRRIAETEFVDKSVPEHDEMRALITKLRGMQFGGKDFDSPARQGRKPHARFA